MISIKYNSFSTQDQQIHNLIIIREIFRIHTRAYVSMLLPSWVTVGSNSREIAIIHMDNMSGANMLEHFYLLTYMHKQGKHHVTLQEGIIISCIGLASYKCKGIGHRQIINLSDVPRINCHRFLDGPIQRQDSSNLLAVYKLDCFDNLTFLVVHVLYVCMYVLYSLPMVRVI